MNDLSPIILWLQNKLPLIALGLLGGLSGEISRGEETKKRFKLKYIIIYIAASLLIVGFIDSYDLPIGYQVGAVIAGGFIGKELLVFAAKKIKNKIGVQNGDDDTNRD